MDCELSCAYCHHSLTQALRKIVTGEGVEVEDAVGTVAAEKRVDLTANPQ